jgi:hypothetical protein
MAPQNYEKYSKPLAPPNQRKKKMASSSEKKKKNPDLLREKYIYIPDVWIFIFRKLKI